MWEPVTDELKNRLRLLNLCSPRDLRRCRPIVRRLARDLPTFDSVWLDALVQLGRLTPFQARRLNEPRLGRLCVGPAVFIDRLGGGPLGETFLARIGPGRERCALKLLRADLATLENEDRLNAFISQLKQVHHPSLVSAHACDRVDDYLVVVSRHVAGPHLAELLVRRGRFPAAVVWEIGRQLVEALALLEQRGVPHGDIRLSNVRLTGNGIAVLVDGGVRAVLDPGVSVHSRLPPDRYDGLAPEFIGTNHVPDAASDRYALGCLLWQLLAGRPPFPGGDPLAKLDAHRNRRIADVRDWAPDVPSPLAEAIGRMTDRDPARRPATYQELLELWGPPSRRGRRQLAAFRRWFNAPARSPRSVRQHSAPRTLALSLAALAGCCALAMLLWWQGAGNVLLATAGPDGAKEPIARQTPPGTSAEALPDAAEAAPGEFRPLPQADPAGTIRLDGKASYAASDIHAVGPLRIVGPRDGMAEIVVAQSTWRLSAEQIRFDRVQISRRRRASARSDAPLLSLEAQSVAFEHSRIAADGPLSEAPRDAEPGRAVPAAPACIAWRMVDPGDRQGGDVVLRDCVLAGPGPTLHAADVPRRVEFSNCLRLGPGSLIELGMPPGGRRSVGIHLIHTTCRGATSLLRLAFSDPVGRPGQIIVEARDCVFDLPPAAGGLLEVVGRSDERATWLQRIRITGEGSIAPPGVRMVATGPADGSGDAPQAAVEGILTGGYQFVGEATAVPADSEVGEWDAPRRTPQPPGIMAGSLPPLFGKRAN